MAELKFVAAMVPAILGLALLPAPPPLARDRVRILLDGAVVAASLLFLSWGTGLGLVYENGGGSLNERVGALAHPFADLVLTIMVIFVLYGAASTLSLSRLLLGIGFLVIAVSDSAGSWIELQAIPRDPSVLISWGWVFGFTLVGLGGLQQWHERRSHPASGRVFAAGAAVLYLPLLASATLAVSRQLSGQDREPFLFWIGLTVFALVVAREVLTLRTNRALLRSFDQRLAARTEALSRSEKRFRTLVDGSADALMVFDEQGMIGYESQSVERVLGRAPGSNRGRSWLDLVHPDDQARLQSVLEKSRQAPGAHLTTEARISHGDDGWRQAELTITNQLDDPTVKAVVFNLRDVTERKALEDQLAQHALHDPLTGLANRALFRDRLHQSVTRAARRPEQPAVVLLDVDGLKHINETLGNQTGDQVLVAVAERIHACVRTSDTVARFGGDEFVILLEDTENEASPALVAERIQAELERVKLGEPATALTASIGIASLLPTSQNPDELLRNADTALAEAKAAGAGKIAVYDRTMTGTKASQRELEAYLQRAIERKEFVIHYQPIVRLRDGRPNAVEALVRWMHPWRGMLLPGDFMLAADKTGAIVSLGRWILLETCRQVRRWQEELELPTLGLAVNLSVRQLNDEGLTNDIRHVLSETHLEPALLMLETTETALFGDLNRSMAILTRLKELGTNLAIDDCRSGHASLAYLRDMPVDTIKIDRSFVMNLAKLRERSQVESMIATGASLNIEIVAEGIEEASQAAELIQMGCELGQGFHFSKPLAPPQMFDYLDKRREKAA